MTIIAAMAALSLPAATLELNPTEDIWVYPHASSQESDPYLRVWGGPEGAVSLPDFGNSGFSYSLLRFTLPARPEGALKEAKLIITFPNSAGFTAAESKSAPLEARQVNDGFTEKTWNFSKANDHVPASGPEVIFGTGFGGPSGDGDFKIEINLLEKEGRFAKALDLAFVGQAKTIALALTSSIDPESMDGKTYKFFSRHADKKEQRPTLKLTFE